MRSMFETKGKKLELEKPHEIEVFVEVGYDDERRRQCPVGRHQDGRRILFRREHHNLLRPGEVWICNILEDRASCLIVAPFKRTQSSPIEQAKEQKAMIERLAPEVATTIVNALEDKIAVLRKREEECKEPLSVKRQRYQELQLKLAEIQAEMKAVEPEMAKLEDKLTEITAQVRMYEKAIERFNVMSVPDDTTAEEFEKEAGIYGIPDYWGERTEQGRTPPPPNPEPDQKP